MTKYILDVGNCSFDHGQIKRLIETSFDAQVVRSHDEGEAITRLQNGEFALVLVNRIMISDFDDYQQRAVQIGAEPGFGKKSLHSPETRQRLAKILGGTDANSTI